MDSSEKASHPFMYFDLLDACHQPGCPVCSLSARSVRHYLDGLFYEFVNDPVTRDSLLNSQGFCAGHAELLLETRIADALGASIIYKNIVKKILENFPKSSSALHSSPISDHSKERARLINKFMKASNSPGQCPVCEQREAASERALAGLSKSLNNEDLQLAFQGSDGLCFSHLTMLLERTESLDDSKFLLNLTRNKLESLHAEMTELIRKNDYRFQSEGITEREGLAWRKAMSMISGAGSNKTQE